MSAVHTATSRVLSCVAAAFLAICAVASTLVLSGCGGADVWESYLAKVSVGAELDVSVADDDVVTISVTGVGTDVEGDTGYLMTITNNGSEAVVVTAVDSYVDGVAVEAGVLYCELEAGETAEDFLFIDQKVATVDESSAYYAKLAVLGDDAQTLVATYEMSVNGGTAGDASDAAPEATSEDVTSDAVAA